MGLRTPSRLELRKERPHQGADPWLCALHVLVGQLVRQQCLPPPVGAMPAAQGVKGLGETGPGGGEVDGVGRKGLGRPRVFS